MKTSKLQTILRAFILTIAIATFTLAQIAPAAAGCVDNGGNSGSSQNTGNCSPTTPRPPIRPDVSWNG